MIVSQLIKHMHKTAFDMAMRTERSGQQRAKQMRRGHKAKCFITKTCRQSGIRLEEVAEHFLFSHFMLVYFFLPLSLSLLPKCSFKHRKLKKTLNRFILFSFHSFGLLAVTIHLHEFIQIQEKLGIKCIIQLESQIHCKSQIAKS